MLPRTAALHRMTPPVTEDRGLLLSSGSTVPTDGTDGYQPGCIFQHTDGSTETALYVNEGSVTSCLFVNVRTADFSATSSKLHTIPNSDWRCEDALQTHLPASPDGDGGTLGLGAAAGSPILGTSTNNSDATEKMSYDFVLPEGYVSGETVTARISAYVTAAANATSDLDVVAKKHVAGALGSDICTTSAIDMKDVIAAADQDFVFTGDSLNKGDVLNITVSFQRNDTGGSTAGTTRINSVNVAIPSKAVSV